MSFLVDYIAHYNITPFHAAILLSVLCLYVFYLFERDRGVPPGPKGVFLFGYWPFLKEDTSHIQLTELAKKYGDVYSLRSAGKLFIHIGSIKAIKEAHLTKSAYFDGRYTDYSILSFIFQNGITFLTGEQWKILRKFFLLKFKEYGMNSIKENMSCSVFDALKDTVEELRNTNGRPVKIAELATSKCMKVMRRIVFNDEGITQEDLQELNDHYVIVASTLTSTNFFLVGNFARYCILSLMPSYWSMRRSNDRIEEILFKVVEKHKAEFHENRISDLIDCYLKEREDRRKQGDPTAAHFTDQSLVTSLGQIVTDGVLTTGLLIGVFLQTLVERPEEQEKIYEEIIDAIGPDRLPTMEDKTKLPYTNAFIYEVMRYCDFFPLFPGLECSKETTLFGHKIPKGAITMVNLYAMHRNPETYENPDEFNPSRFLKTPRPDLPLLFGIGKRSCIGEAFSMIQIFLLVTTILQNFRLQYPKGSKPPESMFWLNDKIEICAFSRS